MNVQMIEREAVKNLESHFGVSSLSCIQESYTLEMKDGSMVKIPGSVHSAHAGDESRPATGFEKIDYENAVKVHRYYSDDEVTERTVFEIV